MVGDMQKFPPVKRLFAAVFALVSLSAMMLPATAAWAEPDGSFRAERSLKIAKTGDDVKPTDTTSVGTTEQSETKSGGIGTPPKSELVAGGIRARLKPVGAGDRFSAGSAAFAEIMLTNVSGTKQAAADVVLETEQARILDISGVKAKLSDSGNHQVVSVTGLRKGKPRKVTVELQLRAEETGQGQLSETINSLKITLRPQGGGDLSDSTLVTWPVADCAGRFYSEIVSIREQNSDRMGKALKAAWRRDASRPGRWLFKPPVSSSKRICNRRTRTWDSRRGRYRYRCTFATGP